jgi:hypothetical protein
MRSKISVFLGIVGGCSWLQMELGRPVSASFDSNKEITLNGVLARVMWRSPYICRIVDVKDSKGNAEAWAVEGDSPTALSATV